jgi:hypothetical protein
LSEQKWQDIIALVESCMSEISLEFEPAEMARHYCIGESYVSETASNWSKQMCWGSTCNPFGGAATVLVHTSGAAMASMLFFTLLCLG